MFDGEDLLELLRNGFGICNFFCVIFEFLWNWDVIVVIVLIFVDIELEEVEFSDFMEIENNSEVGISEVLGLWNYCLVFNCLVLFSV